MRAPLDVAAVRAALDPSFVRSLEVVDSTASTNADLLRAAAAGAEQGTVLVAEEQLAGRGRFERTWMSPARAGLTFSLLLRPALAPDRQGWVPLLTGLALCAAVQSLVPEPTVVALKWPNDLLVRDAKAAGILAEAAGGAVVVGIGINVSHTRAELPEPAQRAGPQATSLALAFSGHPIDRAALLVAVLHELQARYSLWIAAGGAADALAAQYRQVCSTIGAQVWVTTPTGSFSGRAVDIDDRGGLLVDTGSQVELVSAADIAHVRRDA